MPQLDLTNVINITVLGAPSSLGVPNINTACLFSTEAGSNYGSNDYKLYTNPSDVGVDFGTNSKAFAIATAFFAQQPNPLGTGGYLVIVPLLSGGSELVKDAIIRTKDEIFYFGILVDTAITASPFATLTTYIQSIDKVLFYASALSADYAPGGLLDLLRTGSKTQSRGLFYNDSTAQDTFNFAAAYAARALSTDFSGSNTTMTMHLKTLAGINPDPSINQTELNKLITAGVDGYVNIAGLPSLFTSGANKFFDEVYNEFWLKFAMQTAGYNFLRGTSTKIPQTEQGIEGLKNEYRKICEQAVRNGFIGPGAWNSSSVFGNPESLIRSVKDIGYYVYSLPINQQLSSDRAARKAPLIQIAVKAQGAIHSSNVIVQVNA